MNTCHNFRHIKYNIFQCPFIASSKTSEYQIRTKKTFGHFSYPQGNPFYMQICWLCFLKFHQQNEGPLTSLSACKIEIKYFTFLFAYLHKKISRNKTQIYFFSLVKKEDLDVDRIVDSQFCRWLNFNCDISRLENFVPRT